MSISENDPWGVKRAGLSRKEAEQIAAPLRPTTPHEQMIAQALSASVSQLGRLDETLERGFQMMIDSNDRLGRVLTMLLEVQQRILNDLTVQLRMETIRADRWEQEARDLALPDAS